MHGSLKCESERKKRRRRERITEAWNEVTWYMTTRLIKTKMADMGGKVDET